MQHADKPRPAEARQCAAAEHAQSPAPAVAGRADAPWAIAQRALSQSIAQSPRMMAQRRQIDHAFGPAPQPAQRRPSPNRFAASGTAAVPRGGDVVQRRVGFEFETGWDVRKPALMAWNTDTALVRGTNWQISPDEIAGNDAKVEFKTEPFDVDADNVDAIATPIADMFTGLDRYVQSRLLPLPAGQFSPLATQIPAANGVRVRPVGALAAKPQVTGGVRSDLVFSFLKDLAADGGDTELMPGQGKKQMLGAVLDRVSGEVDERSTASREYWGVVALLSNLVVRFQDDKTRALADYREWRLATQARLQQRYDDWVQRVNPDEQAREDKRAEVQAHFAQLSLARREAIRREQAPSYAKARASALPRIAFNDLPQVALRNLLRDVLQAAGLAHPADGNLRMFPLGMKDDADFQETIAQWIHSIQQPIVGGGEGELWSRRSLGTEPVGPPATRGRGVPFELRGLPSNLPYGQWQTFAAPFIAYFAEINRRAR